jgi:carbonic anhydrase/acetyltransferase-like protein (isoleucine patch superfamily)
MAQYVPRGAGAGPLHAFEGRAPKLARSLAAPTSALVGDVQLADDAGVFFGCAVVANGATIAIGNESNIQDNSILATDRTRGDLIIGKRVTFGHNVRMGSGTVGDEALVGMSATVGDHVVVEPGGVIAAGAVVEPGTRVKSGWIWAGRPAREFRPLKPAERAGFDTIIGVYVAYANDYRAP